ncbi:bifunctional metallophosphatase/5'-nucleotidase [Chungangia koreensis]|uniref:Bifunctional metallophosphatase/5'-nucleotidase n=1 Tax=Chungangia koreensis TaxID=752657 RepID=A0ABV8X8T9_9LACT
MIETIHFYHTNDLHSHFQHWPKIRHLLNVRKQWHEEEGESCFLLDIGDHVDRSHPFTEGTFGKGNVQLLNEAGYDLVTIGNNEGITMHKDRLSELYEQANFDVIVCNLYEKDGSRPAWLKPYEIIETKTGVKIGVIGATAAFTPFYERLGWTITPGREEIRKQVHLLKDQTDLIIILSHLGIHEDEQLAEECPDIDVIFGAHTHHVLHEGKQVGDTLLTGAGKFGQYVGHVMVELDSDQKTIVDKKAILYDANELDESSDQNYDDELINKGHELLKKPLFYNGTAMKKEWFSNSKLSSLFGQSLLDCTGADCALFNAGIFLDGLPEGNVTAFDIHQTLPHPINLTVVELTGAELKEAYLQSLNADWPAIEIKGLGFRGSVMGKLIWCNMKLDEEKRLLISGEHVDPQKEYRLATLDMFTFGFFFPSFQRAPKIYYMPEFIRDIFADYLIKTKPEPSKQ